MKLESIKRPYDIVVSLGFGCDVAHQLRRHNLRTFSGPLDWKTSENVNDVCRLIENRFENFMDLENMEMISKTSHCYVLRDHLYNIVSVHDFPIGIEWTSIYPSFKEQLNRRIHRFLTKMDTSSSILFIRNGATLSDAVKLKNTLGVLTRSYFDLLIVNSSENSQGIIDENWEVEGICSAITPFVPPKGDNVAWDILLSEVTSNEFDETLIDE